MRYVYREMPADNAGVHVVTTERRYKGKTYRSHLLRRSFREEGKVKKETVANLTSLGSDIVDLIRDALRGHKVGRLDQAFHVTSSRHHGHVQAVLTAMRRLGLANLMASRACRERELVLAMVAARVLEPQSKLATTNAWAKTTLPEMLGVHDATEDDLYAAMDWLFHRQDRIESKLAKRHLTDGGLALYDLSSTYFEGTSCPLAAIGYSRDGKRGSLQINFGLMTDKRGCPVAVSVFDGNTGDPKTLLPQVQKLQGDFGLKRCVLVGDRGMITDKQVSTLRDMDGLDWVTAVRPETIRKLVHGGQLQLGLFDERNLFEVSHPDFPGERLVACRNPELAKLRNHKRQSLLEATAAQLDKVRAMVERGRLKGKDKIGLRVGRVVNKYKVAKHFKLAIAEDSFAFEVNERSVREEAALDGIYVVRTSVSEDELSPEDAVRTYKLLSEVERAFRSLKTVDLNVRPIYHRLENRVRAHIFLCTLAYYVKWHMMEAWRPLLFADEDQTAKATRDPVAPARRSNAALKKLATKQTSDGYRVHNFQTLLGHLSTIVRNTCRAPASDPHAPTFALDTQPTEYQRRALGLLATISV